MIQAGEEDPITKNAPIQLLPETFVILKSALLMDQFLPPNESATFTLVLQAAMGSLVTDVTLD